MNPTVLLCLIFAISFGGEDAATQKPAAPVTTQQVHDAPRPGGLTEKINQEVSKYVTVKLEKEFKLRENIKKLAAVEALIETVKEDIKSKMEAKLKAAQSDRDTLRRILTRNTKLLRYMHPLVQKFEMSMKAENEMKTESFPSVLDSVKAHKDSHKASSTKTTNPPAEPHAEPSPSPKADAVTTNAATTPSKDEKKGSKESAVQESVAEKMLEKIEEDGAQQNSQKKSNANSEYPPFSRISPSQRERNELIDNALKKYESAEEESVSTFDANLDEFEVGASASCEINYWKFFALLLVSFNAGGIAVSVFQATRSSPEVKRPLL